MKVVVVSTWLPTPAAPVTGTFVRKDAQALARDHEVSLIHLAPPTALASAPREELDGAVRVTRIPFRWDRPADLARARSLVMQRLDGADLLHTMAFSSLLPLAFSRPRVPWVHTEHWSGISVPASVSPVGPYTIPLLAQLLRRPDVVVPVCEFLARPVRRYRSGPVQVVPCIVDQPVVVPERRAPGSTLRLVSVGGLVEGKDPLLAVDTVAELLRRGVPAQLTWVGEGPLRGPVLGRAQRLGVADRVSLVGARGRAQVAGHLQDADLFLLPTRHENFCVSAAEALANGRPVVVGAIGGQAEYVDDAVGQLVVSRTPQAYADAVLGVRDRLAGVAAERIAAGVRRRFDEDAVRVGYREVYRYAATSR